MITRLHETSVLEEIMDLDPELNGDAEYFPVGSPQVTVWRRVRQSASPIVVTVSVLTILLVLAVNLPS